MSRSRSSNPAACAPLLHVPSLAEQAMERFQDAFHEGLVGSSKQIRQHRGYFHKPAAAVLHSLRNSLNFRGNAGRGELLWYTIFASAATALIYKPLQLSGGKLSFTPLWIILFPLVSLAARRLRTVGWSPWLTGIAFFSPWAWLVLMLIAAIKPASGQKQTAAETAIPCQSGQTKPRPGIHWRVLNVVASIFATVGWLALIILREILSCNGPPPEQNLRTHGFSSEPDADARWHYDMHESDHRHINRELDVERWGDDSRFYES